MACGVDGADAAALSRIIGAASRDIQEMVVLYAALAICP
jgi:hypothetical protein